MRNKKTCIQQLLLPKKRVWLTFAMAVMLLVSVPAVTLFAQVKTSPRLPVKETGTKNADQQKSEAQTPSKSAMQQTIKQIPAMDRLTELKVSYLKVSKAELTTKQSEENAKAGLRPLDPMDRLTRDKNGNVPNGAELLGRGYNVHTGKYAEAASVLQRRILDIGALVDDGHIGIDFSISADYYRYEAGESVSKYSEKTATSVGIKGSYGFFKASASYFGSSEMQSEYGRSFAGISNKWTIYRVYINPDLDLRYYLTEAYKEALKAAVDGKKSNGQAYTYANLIDDYGTHVLCSAVMGGKFDYYTSMDYSYSENSTKTQYDVEAGYNAMVASVKFKVGHKKDVASSEFKKSESRFFQRLPSIAGAANDDKWLQMLPSNAILIDFQDKSVTGDVALKYLYDVSKNATIWGTGIKPTFTYNDNTKFVSAYKTYANGQYYPTVNGYPVIDCITGLKLIQSTQGAWKNLQATRETHNDGTESWWRPIGPIGGSRNSYYTNETQYVLFARFGKSSKDRPPVVYVGLQQQGYSYTMQGLNITSFNLPDGSGHQAYYVPLSGQSPKSTRTHTSIDAVHFNVGGGSAQRGDDLVLFYVASPWLSKSVKPITQLRFSVREGSTVEIPAGLHGSFSSIVYNGKEKDTAENWQNYKGKSSDKYPKVYGQNYLQYSYDLPK